MKDFGLIVIIAMTTGGYITASDPPKNIDPRTPLPLIIRVSKIAAELKLTDDQHKSLGQFLSKSSEAVMTDAKVDNVLADTLTKAQYKRAKEISWQIRDGAALSDTELRKALKTNAEQDKKIEEIWTECVTFIESDLKKLRFKNDVDRMEYVTKKLDLAGLEMIKVLSKTQNDSFIKLKGDAFSRPEKTWSTGK